MKYTCPKHREIFLAILFIISGFNCNSCGTGASQSPSDDTGQVSADTTAISPTDSIQPFVEDSSQSNH